MARVSQSRQRDMSVLGDQGGNVFWKNAYIKKERMGLDILAHC
jgi:hypothetical protein